MDLATVIRLLLSASVMMIVFSLGLDATLCCGLMIILV
jgi:hypothetical protein